VLAPRSPTASPRTVLVRMSGPGLTSCFTYRRARRNVNIDFGSQTRMWCGPLPARAWILRVHISRGAQGSSDPRPSMLICFGVMLPRVVPSDVHIHLFRCAATVLDQYEDNRPRIFATHRWSCHGYNCVLLTLLGLLGQKGLCQESWLTSRSW